MKYKKTENEDIFIISRNVQFLTKITWNQFSTLLEFFRTLLEIVWENATLLENINTLLKIHSLCLLPQKAQFKPNFTVVSQHLLVNEINLPSFVQPWSIRVPSGTIAFYIDEFYCELLNTFFDFLTFLHQRSYHYF